MQLILAIDSDPRRSEQLANLVRSRLQVDLVQATSAGEALHALKDRVPDLILTSPLLSPFDDGVLDEYLRDLGSAATHVQTVRIPMLSTGPRKKSAATRLFSLGRKKTKTSSAAPDGCDPKVFADEIAHYLTRSLEDRTASAKTTADKMPPREFEPAPADYAWGNKQPVDVPFARGASATEEWDAPQALVEEFRAPIEPSPQAVTPEPVFEETHVPGSILDLRTPIVHAPAKRAVVKPEPDRYVNPEPSTYVVPEPTYVMPEPTYAKAEPTYVKAEPTYVEPEPTYVKPEPTYVMPEPTYVKPAPTYVMPQPTYVKPEPTYIKPEPTYVTPEPTVVPEQPSIVKPASVSAPAPAATASGNSASFEAALAAIRAAWAKPESAASKPESTASRPEPKQTSPAAPATAGNARPLAGSGEVDLTSDIDSLEDSDEGATPAADEEDSPDGSTSRRKVERPKKRPEKPRARKMRGPDGHDEWGVYEVTDSDETPTRATNVR